MTTLNNKKHCSFILALFFSFFLFIPGVLAQEVCDEKEITIIARNSDGEFIPNVSFSIYQQVLDVDGNPKPGKVVASGKTDPILGKGTAVFRDDENDEYVIKLYTINKDIVSFYYYDELTLSCGESKEITKNLSAIKFTLRDTDGQLRKNVRFSLYTERLDADSIPIKEKQDLVATLDSSEEGEVTVYVPSTERSIDGKTGGIYVFEYTDRTAGTFTKYDIYANNGNTTKVNYIFSDLKLVLKDANGIRFPANTKIEMYEQIDGTNDEEKMGDSAGIIYTNDNGIAIFEHPEGKYMARILGDNKQYYYILSLFVFDQKRTTRDITIDESWSQAGGECEADSTVTIITRDYQNNFISGLNYELYEQVDNADGLPAAGDMVKKGEIDEYGKGIINFNPDPRVKYALKFYDKNAKVGDYWYFNQFQLKCDQDKEITKKIPAIHVILRDGAGELLKNHRFSIYTQKYDVDGEPIKEREDLVSSAFTTSEEGGATIFVAPRHDVLKEKRGTYVLSVSGASRVEYNEFGIIMPAYQDIYLDYTLSDIIIKLKNPAGRELGGIGLTLYEQIKNSNGANALGDKLITAKTDEDGEAVFEYPYGVYAIVAQDSGRRNNIFWNIEIKNRERVIKNLTPNLTRITVLDSDGKPKAKNTTVSVFLLEADENGDFYKTGRAQAVRVGDNGYAEASLAPGPYLFLSPIDKVDYGLPIVIQNGELQTLTIKPIAAQIISAGQKFKLDVPIPGSNYVPARLRGRILLQVEEHGEAWYVHPAEGRRYYMANGFIAYEMMRRFGIGITNENLKKIPVGIDARFNEYDNDGDGIPNKMEEALGTGVDNPDSDGDGYNDGTEVKNGYNPLGAGKLSTDENFANKLKGKIYLQVESRGEAWYINPDDGKRYYMKDGDSAYEIMRFLSLGITNEDLGKITEGVLE